MQQLRIACIGAGYWGRNIVRNMAELGVLDTICETDAEARQSMSSIYPEARIASDPSVAFDDPGIGAVCIASPAETHGTLVRAALLAGKDVLVEKPLCLSVVEGDELVRLADEHSRILMVGHLLWYHPGILKLKALIDAGELGRLQYVYSNRLNLGKIRREENILWSFAPHDISVLLGLVGEEPTSTEARGGNYLHNQIADVTVSIFSFPSGVKGHVFVSWLHPFKEQKLVVVGDRQMAVFDDVERKDKLVLFPHTIAWRNGQPMPNKAEGKAVELDTAEPLRAECEHFIDSIRTRATPRTDGREGVRVLRVLDACQRSLGASTTTQIGSATGKPSYFVHESSFVDENVEIGEGTSIWHFSHILKRTTLGRDCRIGQNVVIGPNVRVGRNVKVQNNVSVYEGVTLEDNVFCGPSMVFTNVFNPRSEIRRMDELRPTVVREGASLGANCTVVCGITIGRYAFVGAGAVVHRDIPDYALVVGNPGRVIGFVCRCGNRINFVGDAGECTSCGMAYSKVGNSVAPAQGVAAR